MAVKTYKKGAKKKLTNHFNLSEMHCRGTDCCKKTKVDTNIVKYAEKIRVMLGVSLKVNSGYRCSVHNKKIGGANGSGHVKGTALDIYTSKFSNLQMATAAEIFGCPRIGFYDSSANMIHIGTGVKLHWINTGKYLPTSHSFIPVAYKKPPITVVVKKGAKAKYIAYVQACLFARGYLGKNKKSLVIDGKWGTNTKYAINTFRVDKGWKPTGYLKAVGIKALLY